MNIPIEIFILVATFAGTLIGALGVHLYYRPRLARKEKEAWRQARTYYTHR